MELGCVVMAAGSGLRFGGNKLAQRVGGKPLFQRALEAVPGGVFRTVAVVTQYDAVAALAASMGFRAVRNLHPSWGISHTIRLGLRAVEGCGGALFMTADQPFLTAETVTRLAQAFLETPDRIVAAAGQGKRGSPCLFPSGLFPALAALEGDVGGAKVIRAHPDRLRLVEVPPLELADADTPEALAALRRLYAGEMAGLWGENGDFSQK